MCQQSSVQGLPRFPIILLAITLLSSPVWGAPSADAGSFFETAADEPDLDLPLDRGVSEKSLKGIVVLDVDGPKMSQLYTWGTATRQIFVAVADAAWFEATNSTLEELPFPASYRVLSLSAGTGNGSVLPEPVAAALRNCAQMSMVAQMESERWSLEVRMEDPSWVNLSPNGETLTVHFAAEGQFRCGLVTK